VKRGELIRRINRIAKDQHLNAVFTEGGGHTRVQVGGKQTTIPRHSDVNELTAKSILRYLKG